MIASYMYEDAVQIGTRSASAALYKCVAITIAIWHERVYLCHYKFLSTQMYKYMHMHVHVHVHPTNVIIVETFFSGPFVNLHVHMCMCIIHCKFSNVKHYPLISSVHVHVHVCLL